jgi:hypothetical protein
VQLGVGQTREIAETKASVAGITIEGKSGSTAFMVKCTTLEGVSARAGIHGGAPGGFIEKWKLTGCTMPTPANCAVKAGTITTEELGGYIGVGLGRSSGKMILSFATSEGKNFMVIEAINSGGACSLGNITVDGDLLSEALDPKDELYYQEFLFEPEVKNTWATLDEGVLTRYASGLGVGAEHLAISGKLSFAALEEGSLQAFTVE